MENLEITLTSPRKLRGSRDQPAPVKPESIIKQLTARQRAFCLEYLVDFNASAAARRAGFSKKTARDQAADLLRHPAIARYLSHAVSVKLQKLDTDSNALLAELARLSTVNLKRAYRPDGSFLPLHDMPDDVARCICGIETEEEYEIRYEDGSGKAEDELEPVLVRTVIRKVKFWDKNKAADTLAKCMKLYAAGSTVNVNVTLEQLVMQSIGQSIEAKPASQVSAVLAATQQPALEHQPGAALTHAADNATATPAPGVGSRAGLVDSSEGQP